MSTVTPQSSSILRDADEGRATLLPWTVEPCQWAIRSGYLEEDPTYELLDGWIVCKDRSAAGEDPMTSRDRHRMAVIRLARLAPPFDVHGCFLQSQQPVTLPPHHEPEPDAAIIRGQPPMRILPWNRAFYRARSFKGRRGERPACPSGRGRLPTAHAAVLVKRPQEQLLLKGCFRSVRTLAPDT